MAKAFKHALTSRRPQARYLVGMDARGMAALFALAPTRVTDWIVGLAVKRMSSSHAHGFKGA